MGKKERQQRRAARKGRRAAKKETRQAKQAVKKENRAVARSERRENKTERQTARKEDRAERKDQRQQSQAGRKGLGKFVHAIGGNMKGIVQSTAEVLRDTGTVIRESRLGQALDNRVEAKFRKLTIQTWPSKNGRMSSFPESSLPEIMNRPNIGICFSGGGNRSAVASFGQMRALASMNFEGKLRYTSSTSGGAWFAVPYTFLPAKVSDSAFYGEYLPPEQITSLEQLRQNARKSRFCLLSTRGKIWGRSFGGGLRDNITASNSTDENWSRAVGNAILKPLDLYDSQRTVGLHKFFTWSATTREAAISKNRFLERNDFHTVERARPFNISVGVLGKKNHVPLNAVQKNERYKGLALFEMTPLYSGTSTNYSDLGGGYIESFGQDSVFKEWGSGTDALVKLKKAHKRFTISDMLGISGSALAFLGGKAFSPAIEHWNFSKSCTNNTRVAMDGGFLDGPALMPLLKRQVKKIIVCMNSDHGIVKNNSMIPNIQHLFGINKSVSSTTIISRFGNHVLSNNDGEFDKLADGVLKKNKETGISFHRGTYQVVANENYGTTPYQVEILWYFLDVSEPWKRLIDEGIEDLNKPSTVRGSLKSLRDEFPNYKTERLNLSEEEVSLLSNYTHWCFDQTKSELENFFNG